ncbi:hypothetical protein C0993_011606 [Termitomyces sp. T159_Od127]|nr:hypothetical protein C0993_011606 [Termitomyces sp. T159_Od127]
MTVALASKSTRLESNARNVILVVAFLLEDDITDQLAIADAVASKVLVQISTVTNKLASSSEFAEATSTAQAETTLALKDVSVQLASVTTLLNSIATKLTSTPPMETKTPQLTTPSWADIVALGWQQGPQQIPSKFNSDLAIWHTRMQQWLLCNMKTVLVKINMGDPTMPLDQSPNGTVELCKHVNKHLAEITATL